MSLLICLYKFSCTRNIIKYFKGRFSPKIIGNLNKMIYFRYLLDSFKNKIFLLQSCLDNNSAPEYIVRHIKKIKCHNSTNVLHAFLKDKISFFLDSIESVKSRLYHKWKTCWSSHSFFNLLHFSKYLTNNSARLKTLLLNSTQQFLNQLIKMKYGSTATTDRHIFKFFFICFVR